MPSIDEQVKKYHDEFLARRVQGIDYEWWISLLLRRVIADERERCAKIAFSAYPCNCEPIYTDRGLHASDCAAVVCQDIASAIRAGGAQ